MVARSWSRSACARSANSRVILRSEDIRRLTMAEPASRPTRAATLDLDFACRESTRTVFGEAAIEL